MIWPFETSGSSLHQSYPIAMLNLFENRPSNHSLPCISHSTYLCLDVERQLVEVCDCKVQL